MKDDISGRDRKYIVSHFRTQNETCEIYVDSIFCILFNLFQFVKTQTWRTHYITMEFNISVFFQDLSTSWRFHIQNHA